MCPLAFSPEAVERMTDVYKRAVQELDLSRAPAHERDRLAVYILSIGKLDDPHRMLDRAVRMYHRLAPGGDGGYKTFTAADGGQVFARYQGTEAATPVYKGKWEFIGGTGRYAGIKGHGTYTYHSVTETTGRDVLEGEYGLP
jgi:hypothetical protein